MYLNSSTIVGVSDLYHQQTQLDDASFSQIKIFFRGEEFFLFSFRGFASFCHRRYHL